MAAAPHPQRASLRGRRKKDLIIQIHDYQRIRGGNKNQPFCLVPKSRPLTFRKNAGFEKNSGISSFTSEL
eukprot:602335-Amorphochlora_amoeboformis.AAC.1